jgi:hypothetical protein
MEVETAGSKVRNSLSASGVSVAAGGRVVAESIVCGLPLVAVTPECAERLTGVRHAPCPTGTVARVLQ